MNERNEIAIFENDIVRLALADRDCEKCDYQLLDEIIYMVINHNEILWQILRDGIKIGDKEYMLFTATTGQVRNVTVLELVQRYISQKRGVKHNTQANYNFVINVIKKEKFGAKRIDTIKLSDAKAWLIKLQDDGKGYSSIHSIRVTLNTYTHLQFEDALEEMKKVMG